MAFITHAIGGVLKAVGLIPKAPTVASASDAPTVDNSGAELDAAAQVAAASMSRGRTSTMLTGGSGVDDTKNTSKVLLGQ